MSARAPEEARHRESEYCGQEKRRGLDARFKTRDSKLTNGIHKSRSVPRVLQRLVGRGSLGYFGQGVNQLVFGVVKVFQFVNMEL